MIDLRKTEWSTLEIIGETLAELGIGEFDYEGDVIEALRLIVAEWDADAETLSMGLECSGER